MSRSEFLDPAVQAYLAQVAPGEHPLLAELRAETAALPESGMQIGADQGAFMALLARSIGARRYLEIGVFTGYSSLAMALALPPDGRVVACDVSAAYAAVARRFWERAGVAERVALRLGPALESLAALQRAAVEPFDIAFVDADKANAEAYYEACLALLRPGGLLLIDNVLWSGRVADPSVHDADTDALRAVVARARADARVEAVVLPLGDGLLVARIRERT